MPAITWKPIPSDKLSMLYSGATCADAPDRACIGHLRGDFGRTGIEFWTSFFDHRADLKRRAFRDELQDVVNDAREKGGILSTFAAMNAMCRTGTPCNDSYGWYHETQDFEYCLRCIPRRGDYNFYLL